MTVTDIFSLKEHPRSVSQHPGTRQQTGSSSSQTKDYLITPNTTRGTPPKIKTGLKKKKDKGRGWIKYRLCPWLLVWSRPPGTFLCEQSCFCAGSLCRPGSDTRADGGAGEPGRCGSQYITEPSVIYLKDTGIPRLGL